MSVLLPPVPMARETIFGKHVSNASTQLLSKMAARNDPGKS